MASRRRRPRGSTHDDSDRSAAARRARPVDAGHPSRTARRRPLPAVGRRPRRRPHRRVARRRGRGHRDPAAHRSADRARGPRRRGPLRSSGPVPVRPRLGRAAGRRRPRAPARSAAAPVRPRAARHPRPRRDRPLPDGPAHRAPVRTRLRRLVGTVDLHLGGRARARRRLALPHRACRAPHPGRFRAGSAGASADPAAPAASAPSRVRVPPRGRTPLLPGGGRASPLPLADAVGHDVLAIPAPPAPCHPARRTPPRWKPGAPSTPPGRSRIRRGAVSSRMRSAPHATSSAGSVRPKPPCSPPRPRSADAFAAHRTREPASRSS